jgi:F0F1-type ATP synthase assembly protein I
MANNHWMLPWRVIRDALALAAIFAVPTFAGVLIGCALDQWQNSEPLFTLVLMGLGVTGGFYGLIATLRHMNGRKHNPGARP